MVQGQGGSSLIELLVAMPIAVVLLGLIVSALGQAGLDQQDVERRTEALNGAQLGLEEMTRELRQATWVYFRSSSVVDLNVRVRPTPSAEGTFRLVRWDCSGDTCVRSEGAPTPYPPPSAPAFATARDAIGEAPSVGERQGQVIGHDVFTPTEVNPDTGVVSTNFVTPDAVQVRLRIAVKRHEDGVVELNDGVSLRNRTTFAGTSG
jgi:type II secretory pathway pseudopilin PulG